MTADTPTREELAPCPFCGEQLKVRPMSAGGVVTKHWSHANPLGDCWAASLMIDEGATEDIAAWNRRALPPAAAGGWRLVPVEPTDAMIVAGWIDKEDVGTDEIWNAMLAASPLPGEGK